MLLLTSLKDMMHFGLLVGIVTEIYRTDLTQNPNNGFIK